MTKQNVAVTLWFGSQLVVVEGVPAYVCGNCRARRYDADVDRRLNSLVAAGFPDWKVVRSIQAPVFAYGEIADFAIGEPQRLPVAAPGGREFDQ
jgi:YgiT-type zinc finger domain-containing protein